MRMKGGQGRLLLFCVYFNGNPMAHIGFAIPREIISACFSLLGSIPHTLVETNAHQNFQRMPSKVEKKHLLKQSVYTHATSDSVISLLARVFG